MYKSRKVYEQKRITKYFMISNDRYRLCYTSKGFQGRSVSIQLNYDILKFGKELKKLIQLKKYEIVKIYTKSKYIHEDDTLNNQFINDIVVDDYNYTIHDLDAVRMSQDDTYSLFCVLERKK